MGRFEKLVVEALGRSPYDDEVLEPISHNQGGEDDSEPQTITRTFDGQVYVQQYDERGHPTNPRTSLLLRDQVRAANEVTEAVGIIENVKVIKAREAALKKKHTSQGDIGRRCMQIGREVTYASTWTLLGLRRRMLLYRSYDVPFIDIIRLGFKSRPVFNLVGSGAPAEMTAQAMRLSWFNRGFKRKRNAIISNNIPEAMVTMVSGSLDALVIFTIARYKIHAALQQLHLLPMDSILPPVFSMNINSGIATLRAALQPSAAGGTNPFIASIPLFILYCFTNLYRRHIAARLLPEIRQLLAGPTINSLRGWKETTRLEAATSPSNSDALEGEIFRAAPERRNTMDSTDGHNTLNNNTTNLSFEQMPADSTDDESEQPPEEFSAEIRNSDPKPSTFKVNELTVLPIALTAEVLSFWMARLASVPLEAIFLRGFAASYELSHGVSSGAMWKGMDFSWNSVGNVVLTFALEAVVLSVVSGEIFAWGSCIWEQAQSEQDEEVDT